MRGGFAQVVDNCAHRGGKDNNISPLHTGGEIIGSFVHSPGKEGIEHGARAPRHPAHLATQMMLLQVPT